MNLRAYLRRIGITGPLRADTRTLKRLHRQHLVTVPFENLSIHMGEPVSLDLAALYDKIVRRRRGGFCYELNGLFAELLRRLGYRVTLLSAGVAKDDIQVSIEGGQVTISAEVKREPETREVGRVLRSERYSGSVYRGFTLPVEIDESASNAKYENGVLELTLTKKAAVAGRKLTVQ